MKIGEVVTLEGITPHGKKIVQESDDGIWVIEQITPATEIIFNSDAPGPWMMLRLEGDNDRRWVSQVKYRRLIECRRDSSHHQPPTDSLNHQHPVHDHQMPRKGT